MPGEAGRTGGAAPCGVLFHFGGILRYKRPAHRTFSKMGFTPPHSFPAGFSLRGGTMHQTIIRHLDELGYACSVHDMGDYVEAHAVALPDGEPLYLVRVEGNTETDVFSAVCELAEAVGVDLDG